jgi:hypothetical protein
MDKPIAVFVLTKETGKASRIKPKPILLSRTRKRWGASK